jgi:hypothetical protein
MKLPRRNPNGAMQMMTGLDELMSDRRRPPGGSESVPQCSIW